ncbi:MAG TPA: TetR/AcrR family transcriptional regulator [Candidatus Angelobacter sp.]|jgi:AcrR family transcriptional regulator
MSGKFPATKIKPKTKSKKKTDRRAQRTRNALGDALVALMQEKPFEEITVQHVLDRAGVGRSTFYAHYSDKNDLFLSDVDEFCEMMATYLMRRKEASDRVAPVRELFEHIADVKEFRAALISSGKVHDVLELGQGHFARGIEQRLAQHAAAGAIAPIRRQALAHGFAGALFSLLQWWTDHGMPGSPAEMDETYHQMVWSGVRASLDTQVKPPAKQNGTPVKRTHSIAAKR